MKLDKHDQGVVIVVATGGIIVIFFIIVLISVLAGKQLPKEVRLTHESRPSLHEKVNSPAELSAIAEARDAALKVIKMQEEDRKPASQKKAEAEQEKKRLREEARPTASCEECSGYFNITYSESELAIVNPYSVISGTPFSHMKIGFRISYGNAIRKVWVSGEQLTPPRGQPRGQGGHVGYEFPMRIELGNNYIDVVVINKYGERLDTHLYVHASLTDGTNAVANRGSPAQSQQVFFLKGSASRPPQVSK